MDAKIAQFVRDRNEALLTLDLAVINAYLVKYGSNPLPDTEAGWAGVHKARTAITNFPPEEKALSKRWLAERGFKHMDDRD